MFRKQKTASFQKRLLHCGEYPACSGMTFCGEYPAMQRDDLLWRISRSQRDDLLWRISRSQRDDLQNLWRISRSQRDDLRISRSQRDDLLWRISRSQRDDPWRISRSQRDDLLWRISRSQRDDLLWRISRSQRDDLLWRISRSQRDFVENIPLCSGMTFCGEYQITPKVFGVIREKDSLYPRQKPTCSQRDDSFMCRISRSQRDWRFCEMNIPLQNAAGFALWRIPDSNR
jgi:hypothetical protein